MVEYLTEVYREMAVLSGSDVIIYCLKSFFEGSFGVFVFSYDYGGWIGLIASILLVVLFLGRLPKDDKYGGLLCVLIGCILTRHYIIAASYIIFYASDYLSLRGKVK